MGMQKTGAPEPVLRDPEQQKTAAKDEQPTARDLAELANENEK